MVLFVQGIAAGTTSTNSATTSQRVNPLVNAADHTTHSTHKGVHPANTITYALVCGLGPFSCELQGPKPQSGAQLCTSCTHAVSIKEVYSPVQVLYQKVRGMHTLQSINQSIQEADYLVMQLCSHTQTNTDTHTHTNTNYTNKTNTATNTLKVSSARMGLTPLPLRPLVLFTVPVAPCTRGLMLVRLYLGEVKGNN